MSRDPLLSEACQSKRILPPEGKGDHGGVFDPGDATVPIILILIHDTRDNGCRIRPITALTYDDIPDIEGTATVAETGSDDDAVADTLAFSIDGNDDGLITLAAAEVPLVVISRPLKDGTGSGQPAFLGSAHSFSNVFIECDLAEAKVEAVCARLPVYR